MIRISPRQLTSFGDLKSLVDLRALREMNNSCDSAARRLQVVASAVIGEGEEGRRRSERVKKSPSQLRRPPLRLRFELFRRTATTNWTLSLNDKTDGEKGGGSAGPDVQRWPKIARIFCLVVA